MRKKARLAAVLLLAAAACSIKMPEITLTGEKTALENQIIGSFEQLTLQNQITTSARTIEAGAVSSEQQESVLRALQNQEFNKDEVEELKRARVVGENRFGFLEVLGNDRYAKDPLYKKLVDQVVEEENRDRRIIYRKLSTVGSESGDETQGRAFAEMQQEKSPPGTMIQLPTGEWIEKPKPK